MSEIDYWSYDMSGERRKDKDFYISDRDDNEAKAKVKVRKSNV
jgi:hypothetical protein